MHPLEYSRFRYYHIDPSDIESVPAEPAPMLGGGPSRCIGVGIDERLHAPAVEDGNVAEPKDAVLFARAADEGIPHRNAGKGLGRLRAEEAVVSELRQVMREGEAIEQDQVVLKVIAKMPEEEAECVIGLLPRDRRRADELGIAADVAPVLLAVVIPKEP